MQQILADFTLVALRRAPYSYTATFIQEGVAEGQARLRFHVPSTQTEPLDAAPVRRERSKGISKTKNPAYRQVSFWIPKELHEAVKIRVIEEGDSGRDQSDLFADALRIYLTGRGTGKGGL